MTWPLREGGGVQLKDLKKPDKYYLSQVTKVNINGDKSC